MTVAFTGHRTINGKYHPDGEWPLVLDVTSSLIYVLHKTYGHVDFISGGALGFDQVAALTVIHLREFGQLPIRLIMALPFKGFESKWPVSSQKVLATIISNADLTNYISNPGYEPWKMMKRNEWMVDNAKTVVALYLGEGKTGGTLNCINYVRSLKKPLITIHPLTRAIEGQIYNPDVEYYQNMPI